MELEQLQDIISEVLNINAEDITLESTFVDDLGADSLDIAQIMMGVEDELGIEIDADEIGDITTVADALAKIKAVVSGADD